MRRFSALLLAALGLGAALALISSHFGAAGPSGIARRGLQSAGIASHLITHAGRGLHAVAEWTVGSAGAQQALEFKPLPPVSVSRLERRRTKRIVESAPAAPEPSAPTPPTPPTPPSPPSRAEAEFGKSGDIMRIGSDVRVELDQVVSGDLLVLGGDITVDGHVTGDVVAMGGDVHLGSSGRVDGDVACIGGELTEEPGAAVGGQRVTAGGMRARGHLRPSHRPEPFPRLSFAGHIVSSMIWLLIMLGVAWGFTQIAPGRTGAALATLRREPAMSIGTGALVWALIIPSMVALALVVAILCITIIGIPIALAALLGYGLFLGLLWVWGYVIAVAAVGEWALRRRQAASSAPAGGVTPELAGAVGPAAEPSLTRKAVLGVLLVSGTGFAGEVLKALFFVPPLHGLGTFIAVVSTIAGGLAATFGAGAWLRTEFVSGTLKRWWGGRKPVAAAPAATGAPTGVDPAAASPPSPASPQA